MIKLTRESLGRVRKLVSIMSEADDVTVCRLALDVFKSIWMYGFVIGFVVGIIVTGVVIFHGVP